MLKKFIFVLDKREWAMYNNLRIIRKFEREYGKIFNGAEKAAS